MTYIFYAVLCVSLLTFLRQAMPKLHPILALIITFVLFQFIWMNQFMPIMNQLKSIFTQVPYMNLLLASVCILIFSEFVTRLLDEHEYEGAAYLVQLSANLSIVGLWLKEISPYISSLQNFMESFELLR